jgi:D-3-phosphoglycerate dehydrogenase
MTTLLLNKSFVLEDTLQDLLIQKWITVLYEWIHVFENTQIDAIMTYLDHKIDSAYLQQYPNCSFVITASTGIDHIDISYCEEKNINIISAKWVNASSVAEFVVWLIILLLRKIPHHIENTKQQIRKQYLWNDIRWKVVWLIWCGQIGQQIAKKLHGFDVWWFIWYDPYGDQKLLSTYHITLCSLEQVLEKSDIISIQLPSTPETYHMIDESSFTKMKKNAYLINVGRWDTVSNKALIHALEKWIIAGAACDVFEWEPEIDYALSRSNSILTPHIASKTIECRYLLATYVINEFLAALGKTTT